MNEILDIIIRSYKSYGSYLWKTITNPFPESGVNFFYFLIVVSLAVWALELLLPWRKEQKMFRKDFWIDTFYMFFNFFIFNLILFIALSNTTAHLFGKLMSVFGLPDNHLFDLSGLGVWVQLIIFFVLADFVQWLVHVMLHRVPWLWEFHKLHHSVTEMGFSAHLRYHFMETFVYRMALYVTLSYILNFKLEYAFIMHMFTIAIGHLNHANLGWDYGPLKYLLNNPKMHIWHHAKHLPKDRPFGMNFGITLSIWDYLFGKDYIPSDGRDIELGFENVEDYPKNFLSQQIEPFKKHK